MTSILYLVFSALQQAQTALDAIYANMLLAIDSPDVLDVSDGQVIDKTELTPDKAVKVNADDRHYPIFGRNAATGLKNETSGYSTAWAVAQQRVTDQKFVFVKPADSLMTGVVYDSVEEYDPAWFTSDELA